MDCPHCHSKNTKRNGHTSYGKQNYQCTECKRQFVEGGQYWYVSDSDKVIIDRLLLERISLAGICRVCDVSSQSTVFPNAKMSFIFKCFYIGLIVI